MKADDRILAEQLGKCPFCGEDIAASLNDRGERDGGMLHAVPMCDRYVREEPDVFLKSVEREREQRKPKLVLE